MMKSIEKLYLTSADYIFYLFYLIKALSKTIYVL